VETMREQEGYKLPITGKYALHAFAKDFDIDVEKMENFVNDCVNEFGLFRRDAEYLWSDSLIRRMQAYEDKSQKARESINKRWHPEGTKDVILVPDKPIPIKKTDEPKAFPAEAVELAELLKAQILNNNAKARIPQNITGWADEMDKLMRIDNRTQDEIRSVILFCQKDPFWLANILSANKLREKYDQLWLQSQPKGKIEYKRVTNTNMTGTKVNE
jgi:hypothetical protein